MKKFSFRLQSVLKVREIHKKLAEKAVSQTQSRLNKVDHDIEGIQQNREQSHYFDSPGQEMTYWMGLCENYRKGLKIQEDQLQEQKDKLETQLHVEKKELIRKLKDEKVMATLKEAQLRNYLIEVDKVEQKEMEELDVMKRGRKA